MPDSLFSSLTSFSKLDAGSLGEISRRLGESEETVVRGLQSAVAALAGGLLGKAKEPGAMRQVVDLAGKVPGDVSQSLAGSFGDTGSGLLAGGKQLLATLFGGREADVSAAVSKAGGLGSNSAMTLLGMAGPLVLGAIGKRIRDTGMTATDLSNTLQQEEPAIRRALPAGLANLLPGAAVTGTAAKVETRDVNPVIAQSVIDEKKRSFPWAWLLLLALLVIGALWYFLRSHSASAPEVATQAGNAASTAVDQTKAAATDAANQTKAAATSLGDFVKRQLPGNTQLNVPENGVESHLLAFIQDPSKEPDKTTWFDFDRLLFDTSAATLQPQSEEQLHNIADILKAYPKVHIRVGGYTDNTGDAPANLKLSQARAESVVAELEKLGVSRRRVDAKGYGEEHPVADNSTEDGRAKNRRVSMLVTAK